MLPTVLAVDDEVAVLRLIRQALKRAGYEVITARDGKEALALLERERPVLIISDVLMPGIGGLELVRLLKERKETRDIPVIMLTSLTQFRDMQRGYEFGALLYLTKPFTVEALQQAVADVLSGKDFE